MSLALRTFSSHINFSGSPSGSSERCETGILWVATSTWVSMGTGFQYPIDPIDLAMSCSLFDAAFSKYGKNGKMMPIWCLFGVLYHAVPSCPNWWIRFHGSTVFHRKSDNIFKVPQQLWRRSHMPPLPQEAMYASWHSGDFCQRSWRTWIMLLLDAFSMYRQYPRVTQDNSRVLFVICWHWLQTKTLLSWLCKVCIVWSKSNLSHSLARCLHQLDMISLHYAELNNSTSFNIQLRNKKKTSTKTFFSRNNH